MSMMHEAVHETVHEATRHLHRRLSANPLAHMDAGELGFLALGAAGVMLVLWQIMQICKAIAEGSTSDAAPEAEKPAPALPRAPSKEKVAAKTEAAKPLRDLEAGDKHVAFLPKTTKPGKVKPPSSRSRGLGTEPLYAKTECASP